MIRHDTRTISPRCVFASPPRGVSRYSSSALRRSTAARPPDSSPRRASDLYRIYIFPGSILMRSQHLLRRSWRGSRNSKRRADLLKRLHIAEQLEVRAAPGSMIADVLALGGRAVAMAPRAIESSQESEQAVVDGELASPKGTPRAAHPQGSEDSEKQRGPVTEAARAERQARTAESEHRQVPARDTTVTNGQTRADSHRDKRSSRTAADTLFSDASLLVGTGLDDGLDASANENRRGQMDGDTGDAACRVHPARALQPGNCRIFPRDRASQPEIEREASRWTRTIYPPTIQVVPARLQKVIST